MLQADISKLLNNFMEDANKENDNGSDRGAILVWASGMEGMLQIMLSTFFIDGEPEKIRIFEGTNSLSTFGSKIDICYACGLIDKTERGYLNTVRSIRNDMAHKLGVDLESGSMRDKCKHLYDELGGRNVDPAAGEAREFFRAAALNLMSRLVARLPAAHKEKRSLLAIQPNVTWDIDD